MTITVKTRLILDLISSFYHVKNKGIKVKSYLGYFLLNVINLSGLKSYMARRPTNAYILLTTKCNMTCHDCCFLDILNKKDLGKMDFDLDQIEKVYNQEIFKSVSRVVLMGGEPTLCKSHVSIIRFFRNEGIVVNLVSNALKVDEPLLQEYHNSDLNLIGFSIYDKTENGMKYNLDKIEAIYNAANRGVFDPNRIQLFYHSTSIEGYELAYDFAKKLKAKHLKFNTTFYSEIFPFSPENDYSEDSTFNHKYKNLCDRIKSENLLILEHPSPKSESDQTNETSSLQECRYTTNGITLGPTNSLSPCCFLSPSERYGTIEDPSLLLQFKNQFIVGNVPSECDGCIMLGQNEF